MSWTVWLLGFQKDAPRQVHLLPNHEFPRKVFYQHFADKPLSSSIALAASSDAV